MTSEIYTTDILDKEHFWTEELMKVNQDFLFGCSTGVWGRGKCPVPVPYPRLLLASSSHGSEFLPNWCDDALRYLAGLVSENA